MDPLSLATSISALLLSCTKIIRLSNDMRQKYKNSALTMANIASEASTVNVALAQLQVAVLGQDLPSWKADGHGSGAILKSFEAVTLSCTMTLSILEEHLLGITEHDGELSTEAITKKERVKFMWNEAEIDALLQQLRGHQSCLGLLLNVLQSHSDIEARRLLKEQSSMSKKILDAMTMSGHPRISLLSGLTLQFGQQTADSEDDGEYIPSRIEFKEEVEVERQQKSDFAPQRTLTAPIQPVLKNKRRLKSPISVAFNFIQNITMNKRYDVLDYSQLREELLPHIESAEPMPGTNRTNLSKEVLKCVLLGNGVTNKQTFCISAIENSGSKGYIPTFLNTYSYDITRKGREITLDLWDVAGQEDYHRLRVLSYPQTDVFIFFFSVVNPFSFKDLVQKWIPEVAAHCPGAGRVLVGVDKSLRTDETTLQGLQNKGLSLITEFQALELAHAIDAQSYVECDLLTQENIAVPFQQAVDAVIAPRRPYIPKRST